MTATLHQWLIGSGWGRTTLEMAQEHHWTRVGEEWMTDCRQFTVPGQLDPLGFLCFSLYYDDAAATPRCEFCLAQYNASAFAPVGPPSR